jgi:hypothetical protein
MSCIYSNFFPLASSYIISCSQDAQTVGPLLFPEFLCFESTAGNRPHLSVLSKLSFPAVANISQLNNEQGNTLCEIQQAAQATYRNLRARGASGAMR